MLVDFVIEGLVKGDHVTFTLVIDPVILFFRAEPQPHGIKEMKARPIDQGVAGWVIFRTEENRRGENPFESLYDSPIVKAVDLQPKEGEHVGGTFESDDSALLLQGKGCDPNRDEPVLPEGKTVVRMADDLKEELAAVPRVGELILRRTAQREPA